MTQLNQQLRLGVTSLRDSPLGIQGCLHVLIEEPSPTHQMIPFSASSIPYSIHFQIVNELPENKVSKRLPLGKYFAFRKHAHKLSGASSSLQACLARSAWLKVRMSQNPISLLDFGSRILSQLNQAIFLLPFSTPNKY